MRFDNSGETAKVVNFKEYLYKADTTKQTTAYVMPDMYNQTKKFIVGSPSKEAPYTQPIISVLFNIVLSIGNGRRVLRALFRPKKWHALFLGRCRL